MSKDLVLSLTEPYQQTAKEYRHHIHSHPELSFEEYQTSAFIKGKLQEFGIPIRQGLSGTSILAELDSGKSGPTVLFRAEMDALPVQEETENPYKSTVSGVMHACGHDIHASLLLAFAQLLSDHRELVSAGKVLFAFQSAEELIPGGAKTMVEEGAAEGVDCAFALHVNPLPVGTVSMSEGPASAAIGTFGIKVYGKGGHTGMPQRSHNPIAALCSISQAIQTLSGTVLDPLHAAAICVSYLNVGQEQFANIIPDSGTIGGSIRCAYTEDRELIYAEIERQTQKICEQYQCRCEFDFRPGYPAVQNDTKCCQIVWNAARELGLPTVKRNGGIEGEDFSYFTQACPSAFFFCGTGNADKPGSLFPNHNPKFDPDEAGMDAALQMLLEIYLQVQSANTSKF